MRKFMILVLFVFFSPYCQAKLSLPNVFTDHMVLQRQMPVKIWGHAEPGQNVTVSFYGNKAKAVSDKNGFWIATLPPMKALTAGRSLLVQAEKEQIVINDILVGEVWLCSGQSNMDFGIKHELHASEEIPLANFPKIRLLSIPRKSSLSPESNFDGKWLVCTPENVAAYDSKGFSAVGYYFGKSIYKKLDVPVGLIHSAWGGSDIATWTPYKSFANFDKLRFIYDQIVSSLASSDAYSRKVSAGIAKTQDWITEAKKALALGDIVPDLEAFKPNIKHGFRESYGLYNGMINPVVPFAIRGAIWYQGEHNVIEGMLYAEKMKALIAGWREVFERKDMPFYYVQLAPYIYKGRSFALPQLWEAQLSALDVANTGMAVTNDIATIKNIHPPEKREVGRRLSLIALAKTYGFDGIVYSGPMYKSMKKEGCKIRLSFEHVGGGLVSRDGKDLTCFEIAEADENFVAAKAIIDGDTIVVSSDKITNPTVVRFAWNETAQPNLMNKAGLPAPAFRTNFADYTLPAGINVAINKFYQCSDKNKSGWDTGLTDGSWMPDRSHCFASGCEDKFPKQIVIDLEKESKISAVVIGVPAFGSTKTIKISLSSDGKNYAQVAQHQFSQGKYQQKKLTFAAKKAKYVKLTCPDYHDKKLKYDPLYVFITEVEVYSAEK